MGRGAADEILYGQAPARSVRQQNYLYLIASDGEPVAVPLTEELVSDLRSGGGPDPEHELPWSNEPIADRLEARRRREQKQIRAHVVHIYDAQTVEWRGEKHYAIGDEAGVVALEHKDVHGQVLEFRGRELDLPRVSEHEVSVVD